MPAELEDLVTRPVFAGLKGIAGLFVGLWLLLLPAGLGAELGARVYADLLGPHLPHGAIGGLVLVLLPSLAFYAVARSVGRRRRGPDGGHRRGTRDGSLGGRPRPRTVRRPWSSAVGFGDGAPARFSATTAPATRSRSPPTRSGKGVGALVPNLLDHPGAVVVTDPKGENYAVTARHRRQAGADVQALDPFDVVGGAAAFNPLGHARPRRPRRCRRRGHDREICSSSRASGRGAPPSSGTTKPRALISGLVLHVAAEERGPRRSLPHVRELLTLPPEDFTGLLRTMEKSKKAHGLVARAAARLRQKSDKERSGVVSSAQNHTHFLDSPRMRRVLARSTFDLAGLKRPTFGLSVGADGTLSPGHGPDAVRVGNGYLSLYLVLRARPARHLPGVAPSRDRVGAPRHVPDAGAARPPRACSSWTSSRSSAGWTPCSGRIRSWPGTARSSGRSSRT